MRRAAGLSLATALLTLLAFAAPAVAQTVTGISPDAGVPGGGTTVMITGSGFTGVSAVDFGTTGAAYTFNSDNSITATSPSGTGTVDVTVTANGQTSSTSSADQFTYENAPTVSGISTNTGVSAGPIAGGTPVTITGSNFTDATGVSFGMTPQTNFTVVSSTEITTTSPEAAQSGTVDVTVTTPVATSADNAPADQFSYDPVPDIETMSPSSGPLTNGPQVKISGSGFSGATAVDFGSNAASFTVNSDGQITATPPAGSEGPVGVTVTTPGGTSQVNGSAQTYTYVAPPAVSGVSPNAGPTTGGTQVTITGTGFDGTTAVQFGSTEVPTQDFQVNSNSTITATSPGGSSGTVDVTVTNGTYGTSQTGSADEFTYDSTPTVTSVTPDAGPLGGNTTITIKGAGFTNAASTTVDVGANQATVQTISSSQITATLPAATNTGTVDVTVTTPGGTSATTTADQFTYDPVPSVTGVSPNVGPTGGVSGVTITGSGFTGATAVDFGGTAASFTVKDDGTITATAPPGTAGAVDVTVTTPGGTSTTSSADQFTYYSQPSVTGVSPGAGPLAGGTTVTITGSGFNGATAVDFGSSPGTIQTVSANQITALSPSSGSAVAVGITVTTPGGKSQLYPSDTDQEFTYTNGPTVTGISPAGGPLAGGTAVTITGTHLGGATVDFGKVGATPSANTNSSITVTSPAATKAGQVNVTVATAGGTSPTTGTSDQFSYDAIPTVTKISPSDGPDGGGTKVMVTGSGFSTGPTTVQFGSTPAQSVSVSSDTELIATAPAASVGTVDITVTTPGGTSSTSSADQFAFTPPLTPAIAKLSPKLGPIGGGTTVTITGSQFTGATAVSFGAKAASSFTVDSDTQITAVSPPGSAGTVPVTVTTAAGGASQSVAAGQFTYAAPPEVKNLAISAPRQRGATLHATVDPNGLPLTACEFEYGTTRHYAHSAACSSPGSAQASVSAKLRHLKPGTRYHYRLVATTASGTTDGPDSTFSTNPLQVVGTPLVGLLLERTTSPRGYIGKLLGVQGISRAAVGESIVVRCVAACGRQLDLRIHLVNARMMQRKISVGSAFPISLATRIEIDVSAPGKLSRYARYSFTVAHGKIAVHITHSGCLAAAGDVVRCPR